MKKYILTGLFLLFGLISFGQGSQIEMADGLRASGKIYVVVLVVFIIFIGLFSYLLRLDRKISNLEKELDKRIQK